MKTRAVIPISLVLAGFQAIAAPSPLSLIQAETYVKGYPNSSEWSESQNAIINAEFQMGLDALTGKQEELAMQRFDAFLRAHPLDERAPRILYLFGAIHEAKALDLED